MEKREGFIVYTTKEGGEYKVHRDTYETYTAAKNMRMLHGERPFYIAWAPIVADHDFILEGPRAR